MSPKSAKRFWGNDMRGNNQQGMFNLSILCSRAIPGKVRSGFPSGIARKKKSWNGSTVPSTVEPF